VHCPANHFKFKAHLLFALSPSLYCHSRWSFLWPLQLREELWQFVPPFEPRVTPVHLSLNSLYLGALTQQAHSIVLLIQSLFAIMLTSLSILPAFMSAISQVLHPFPIIVALVLPSAIDLVGLTRLAILI